MKSRKPEMRDEYDFRKGERGKYASSYAEGTNVVVLDPDVATIFPDAESVNRALRAVGKIIEEHAVPGRRTPRTRSAKTAGGS